MDDCLITKRGELIECLAGATHEVTCVKKFKRTLTQFILQDAGVRVKVSEFGIAIESRHHLTGIQLSYIESILRTHDFFYLVTSIKAKEHTQDSFRPIRGLPEGFR